MRTQGAALRARKVLSAQAKLEPSPAIRREEHGGRHGHAIALSARNRAVCSFDEIVRLTVGRWVRIMRPRAEVGPSGVRDLPAYLCSLSRSLHAARGNIYLTLSPASVCRAAASPRVSPLLHDALLPPSQRRHHGGLQISSLLHVRTPSIFQSILVLTCLDM